MTKKSQESEGKIGIIFLHGAGLGGWVWDEVVKSISVPYIFADYTSLERASSKATLKDYVDEADRLAEKLGVDRLVIVAHSAGGVVGYELGIRLGSRLGAFIAISAAIPKPGGNFMSTLPFPQKIILPLILKLVGTKPPEPAIRSGLGGGLSASQVDEIVANFQQESVHLFMDRISDSPITKTQILYIRTTNDKEFPLSAQNKSIEHLSSVEVFDINSGHMPMLSNADVVAECINKLVLDVPGN